MKFQKGSVAFTLLLAILTAVGPLSTDMYLPSLPAISRSLSAGTSTVQLTLSVFMVGFAIGQIFYGPVSDRFGRKPVLVTGLIGYVAGSIFCFSAPNIEILIVARFFQALGASAAIVLVRAIVRDLFGGEKAARLLSLMGALMGVVPLLAPILGGFLEISYGWRANFAATSIVSALLLIVVTFFLPETLAHDKKRHWSFFGMLRDFAALLIHPLYLRYMAAICLSFGGLFIFISTSSFVLQNVYGLNEIQYGLAFSLCVAGYIVGTLIGARLSFRYSVEQLTLFGSLFLGGGGLAMILLSFTHNPQVWDVLAPMFVTMIGIGLVMPQSMAGALTPFSHMAGTASSLIGFLQNIFAALCAAGVAAMIDLTPEMLVWSIGIFGICNLALSLAVKVRIRASAE
jgi:DHA1 family bicyclomycin/chloramphenicol resistance-like MFS transporter